MSLPWSSRALSYYPETIVCEKPRPHWRGPGNAVWKEREAREHRGTRYGGGEASLSVFHSFYCCQLEQRWITQPGPSRIPDPQNHEWNKITAWNHKIQVLAILDQENPTTHWDSLLKILKHFTYNSKLLDMLLDYKLTHNSKSKLFVMYSYLFSVHHVVY